MSHQTEPGLAGSVEKMQDGFPRSVVLVLVVLFALSLLALLGWLVYFVSDAVFFGRPGALAGL